MKKNERKVKIKEILSIVFVTLLGISCIVFSCSYIDACGISFVKQNATVINAVVVALVSAFTILTVIFYANKKEFLYKIFLITILTFAFLTFCLFVYKKSSLSDKINSIEDFRDYIASFGKSAVLLFIFVQFLQVAVLPIPSFITVGAGVLLFGPLYSAFYSLIGIVLGSLFAFFIGRVFGFKVAKWLVGEDDLNKWLKKVKGKDKILLTFMFLFPFFPDDILCFVAGISTMSWLYFIIMILITRIISVFTSCFSINNSIIPYTTWWGILIWIILFAATISATVYIYKHGDKIQNFFTRKNKENSNKNK